MYQKIIGEFLKRRNTSKHCLQFLHRVGLSLVTMSVRSDQQKMGCNFLKEVSERKAEVEAWAVRRTVLGKMAKQELIKSQFVQSSPGHLKLSFISDEVVEAIVDLGEKKETESEVLMQDPAMQEIISCFGSASEALEAHLDCRPKLQDVTYDNIGGYENISYV